MLGKLDEYVAEKETFTNYVERVEQFFEANAIAVGKQKAVFLATCGASTYETLKNLCLPNEVKDVSFSEIIQKLTTHYTPEPLLIYERYIFGKRTRKYEEKVADFAVDLKRLSSTCKFDAFLDQALCMQFVVGLNMPKVQSRLMQERTLAFDDAVKIAIAESSAVASCANIDTMRGGGSAEDGTVHRVFSKGRGKAQSHSKVCWRCGNSGHSPDNCRFRTVVCHQCKRIGHIKKRCDAVAEWRRAADRAKSSKTNSKASAAVHRVRDRTGHDLTAGEDDGRPYVINHMDVSSGNDDADKTGRIRATSDNRDGRKQFDVSVDIDGKRVIFEIDTAASLSVVGERIYRSQLAKFPLRPTKVSLRAYNGESIRLLGEIQVPVLYAGRRVTLPLIVVRGDKPALFGRNWLGTIRLDWGRIFAVKTNHALDSLLTEFATVFSDDPGEIKGFEANIQVADDAQPIFRKAYQVPFAIRDKVKAQLQAGIDKGLFSPVKSSEWASPQVTVVKQSGDFRLCGDYKVTVNQVLDGDQYPLPSAQDLFAQLSGARYFSKIDLTDAFQQLKLSERSKALLTLNTLVGLLECERLPFGIKTAPQIFQRVMDEMLKDVDGVMCYIDDIMICTKTEAEHYDVLRQVFLRLQKHNVRARLNKCCFLQRSIDYLGHTIDCEGVHPTQGKIEALLHAPVPTSVTELQSFLGICELL